MIQKILGLLTILGFILGGLFVYANTAYFPMARGVEVEQKIMSQETLLNAKLDSIITILEKRGSRG